MQPIHLIIHAMSSIILFFLFYTPNKTTPPHHHSLPQQQLFQAFCYQAEDKKTGRPTNRSIQFLFSALPSHRFFSLSSFIFCNVRGSLKVSTPSHRIFSPANAAAFCTAPHLPSGYAAAGSELRHERPRHYPKRRLDACCDAAPSACQ